MKASSSPVAGREAADQTALQELWPGIRENLSCEPDSLPVSLVKTFEKKAEAGVGHLDAVKALESSSAQSVVDWLQKIVNKTTAAWTGRPGQEE